MDLRLPDGPRRLTLIDLMVVVAGVALGFRLRPIGPGWERIGEINSREGWEFGSIYLTALGPILIGGFAVAAAIVVRLIRHGGRPGVADALAFVLTARLLQAVYLAGVGEDPFYRGAAGYARFLMVWRRGAHANAVGWSLACLVGVGLLAAVGRRLPGWAGAVGATAAATMLLLGPVRIYNHLPISLPSDSSGSSLSPGLEDWWFWLRWCSRIDLAGWPELLLFGIPMMAALLKLRREGIRGHAWTEWAGLTLASVLAFCWWLDRLSFSGMGQPMRAASPIVRGPMLVGTGVASWLVVRVGRAARPGR